MKTFFKSLLLCALLSWQLAAVAQSVSVRQSDYSRADFTFEASKLEVSAQEVNGVSYSVLSIASAAPSTALGRPNLPLVTEMIELPLCSSVKVEVTNVRTKELQPLKYPVMPVQPAPGKSDRGPRPFVIDSLFYATDAFSQGPLAWVEPMGVARDKNVALLRISPLSYNPATGQLQMVVSMDISLTFVDADVAATEEMHRRYYSPHFTLGHQLLSTLPATKEVRNAAPLHYLIVAHSSFRGQLDQFISWKKRQGFLVTVGYTDDPSVGTTSTAIMNYIKGFYDNATPQLPAPTYVLLVGDNEQVPAFASRTNNPASDHVTDLYFTTWTANDNLPDCYIGRFSARTADELAPQIEKTLLYEGYQFADDAYLAKGVLIAGQDMGNEGDNAYHYADPAMDYIAKYYVNAAHGFSNVHYYKNNTSFAPTGVTVSGSGQTTATATTLRALYNEGIGWVNYSAHGDDNAWVTPNFTTSHVAQMTNDGKPSIMIGNCCLTGRFNTNSDACLGEALLRKGNNAGAVSYIGCTNNSYWPHDFCWAVGVRNGITNQMNATYDASHLGMYDRLFHTHNESFANHFITAGAMVNAGNMAVEEYGSYVLYYWEIYELFGDPSLMPWLGMASTLTVEADDAIPLGSSEYVVYTQPYAYVALTHGDNHEFVAAAYANSFGTATLALPSSMTLGEYELTVWAQNYKPYFRTVNTRALNGPYVLVTQMEPTNGLLLSDTVNTFSVTITNVGNASPTEGLILLTSDNPNVVLVEPEIHFTACEPGDTVTLTGVGTIYVDGQLTNGAPVSITSELRYGGTDPTMRISNFQVSSALLRVVETNATPALYSGTSSTITCRVVNRGSLPTPELTFSLVCPFGFLTAEPADVDAPALASGDETTLPFNVTLGDNIPNTLIPFSLYATANGRTQLVQTFSLRCGSGTTENFESGTLTQFNWTHNTNPWEITTGRTHSGQYSARSKNNLGSRGESKMSITWNAVYDDSISFYYRVSSEENWDLFSFAIDGTTMMDASGEVDWTRASFPVEAGTHIFTFTYQKDFSRNMGSDCAWVDDITLPFNGAQSTFLVDTVCQNASYDFYGAAVPTDQLGTLLYVDSSTSTRHYLSLLVVAPPSVTVAVQTIGTCMLLSASGATTYQWSTGETGSHIALCPTEWTQLTVTGFRGGCSASATVNLLGIADVPAQPLVSLYPNPATGSVTVASAQIRSVELVSLVGQTLQRVQGGADRVTLNLQGLAPGVYFVKVEAESGLAVKKLIVR